MRNSGELLSSEVSRLQKNFASFAVKNQSTCKIKFHKTLAQLAANYRPKSFWFPWISNTFVRNSNRTKMNKKTIITAAILGMIAIILGAFGAHALKKVLSIEQLATFETGVRYQMYHALFLLFIGLIPDLTSKAKNNIYNLVLSGVVLFSGSIYLLATNEFTPFFDFKIIGFVTPIGGFLLISAWAVLLYNITKKSDKN